jgi:xanthine dehydrogenase YagT iron-sulfur-binding subunit
VNTGCPRDSAEFTSGVAKATPPRLLIIDSLTEDHLVNGKPMHLALDVRVTVLDVLRDHLHLTGSKKGCDQGQCGACELPIRLEKLL